MNRLLSLLFGDSLTHGSAYDGYQALGSTSADAVHPNTDTQDALKTYFAGDYPRARASAISTYGFGT